MAQNANHSIRMIYWIIMAGVGIRVFAAFNTYVTNPDGMLYIQQAKPFITVIGSFSDPACPLFPAIRF